MLKRYLRVVAGLLVVGILALSGRQQVMAQSAGEVLQLVNGVRANYGLAPFEYNAALAVAAQNHANWMAATGLYLHTGEGGSTPYTRAVAAGYNGSVSENIVGGTSLSPNQGVIWWQNSPVHFNTMISTRYVQAGTGYATDGSQNFYVLVVGLPSNQPAALQPATNDNHAAPVIVPVIQLSRPREDGSIVHSVQSGQTMWAIAARYEVSLADLYLFNGMNEDSVLQPGDELTIRLPDGAPPPPTPTPPTSHLVREGETMWTIAARYRVSLTDIFWLNGLTEESVLQPGTQIVVRLGEGVTPPPTPTPQMSHFVRSGDTLLGIAFRYGLTLDQLLSYNGLESSSVLQIGDELRIRLPDPTTTPFPTNTMMPPTAAPTESVEIAAVNLAVEPTRTPTAPSVAALAAPEATPVETTPRPAAGEFLATGSLLAGMGIIALVGVIAVAIKRQQETM
jgi:LysM repeat protein